MDALEGFLPVLDSCCTAMGLTISTGKSKILAITPSQRPFQKLRDVALRPDDGLVSVVEDFECLGSTLTSDCGLDKEINIRISKAFRSFSRLYRVL